MIALGAFLLGLCVGSFVNVLIWRTLNGMSPYKGRSICDHCKRQLLWIENIPVISYVVLGGKCRTCKKQIDVTYPLVEMLTGLLFLWWATLGLAFFKLTHAPFTIIQPVFWLLIGLILVVIFFADVLYGIIPDLAVVLMGLLSLAYRVSLWLSGQMKGVDLAYSVMAGVLGSAFFLFLYLVTKGRGMGFGDVKFALVMGFILGVPKAIVGFFLSFVTGGMYAFGLLLLGKKKFGQTVAFGPFMIIGLVLALLYGEKIWFGYMNYLNSGVL